jgi:hypothetical protein
MIGINGIIMHIKPLPPIEKIQELLNYDPDTGEFTWKKSRGPMPAGSTAGQRWVDYIRIGIDGQSYQAHRIAWLVLTGEDPGEMIVDHIDLDKQNNRADNLRLSTISQNGGNTLRGEPKCYQKTAPGKYQAVFTLNRKRYTLGTFDTPEEASKVGREGRRKARNLR